MSEFEYLSEFEYVLRIMEMHLRRWILYFLLHVYTQCKTNDYTEESQ